MIPAGGFSIPHRTFTDKIIYPFLFKNQAGESFLTRICRRLTKKAQRRRRKRLYCRNCRTKKGERRRERDFIAGTAGQIRYASRFHHGADEGVDFRAETFRIELGGMFRADGGIPCRGGLEFFDRVCKRFRGLFREEDPGAAWQHGLQRAAFPEGDHRSPRGLRLQRDDAEILDAGEDQGPGIREEFAEAFIGAEVFERDQRRCNA